MTNDLSLRPELLVCESCHVCASRLPAPVLDLGLQPMCDDLVKVGNARMPIDYPIKISLCPQCLTAHQHYQIKKETLFPSDYHYRPRFTQDVLNGMKQLVEETGRQFGSVTAKSVCDVGCNDGSLLNFFREAGAKTSGIEPTGAAHEAQASGHLIVNDYFSPQSAAKLVAQAGKQDIVTFTNVFAHIENLQDAIGALKVLIHEHSLVVIENHYLGTVLETNQFDTFYHEHPRTYSLRSFEFIARSLGGTVLLATFPKRYGGNIRVFIGNFGGTQAFAAHPGTLRDESSFADSLANMQTFVDDWQADTKKQIQALVTSGTPLYGKSFPGRAAILIKLLGIDVGEMPCVYEKPGSLKIGYYLPGTRIPIVSDEQWISGGEEPPAMLIWGWHIADEIAGYLRKQGYRGRIYSPLPKFAELAV